MDRDEVWQAIDHERASLADLFDDLCDQEWATPSLCEGWRVREVAAHLTLAHFRLLPALVAVLRARGNLNRMIHDTAVRQAELPVREYGVLLRAMVGSRAKAPMISDFEPLIDILVHGQDIAIPLRRDRPMPARPAAAAATRVWTMGAPFHARRKLDGLELVATDCSWTAGQGKQVEGPIAAMLLLLTGRRAALAQLSGPGLADLQSRLSPADGNPAT
ncbi:maleylpyruvate isomerase family mycothiol-dependent enzyme [Nonomuraea sp. NPDC059194]|uniref:maleylpyruvate isomerase family mycothiol-dependent enzyme n=1 Tax=Nonomuraea sp. NPDC059194 TaxID=3346764 RepID=UPI0036BB6108